MVNRVVRLVERFIALLPLQQMKSLVIQASRIKRCGFGNFFVAVLPRLSALEHFDLKDLCVCGTPAIQPTTALESTFRTLKFDQVDLSEACLDALVRWATSSKRLELVKFRSCALLGTNINCAGTTLQRCANTGACCVSFLICTSAGYCARPTRPEGFVLNLTGTRLRLPSVQALL
ncbi:LOW QUALITY PROTEIN: hypothetical protein SPRG_00378 [Saprolegnia parasitica CBS 223.65]|uniref:Uncharacterized protein n=1 Tax=Saprolegnia parasitica (strain CBS 223.65) TaxID=695850 RepID=A0A067D951_SAPPC|nr:LOW QUALITY PROTEIN: hypothetical protein SPRG_00378 [Saprolegnia parasitica CBS 223.65]KDO35532.1 LOW QUALITY PROTEIN: hypothetical protein SPRG_00378 [Saprolegnia parasitica CBS 223.65]|eukprot:XP_012193867.1 LOW QUALITY PROTEIN: hypothetical protein SPRG_00378 [Saprolegnia parasitica CBS 223.65]